MSADLTSADYSFMILLNDAGGELSNTEMDQRYQVRLKGTAFAKLNSAGYVKSNTQVRPYQHALTETGRTAVTAYLAGDDGVVVKPVDMPTRQAMVLLARRTAGHDTRSRTSGGVPEPVVTGDLEQRVRAAYAELAARGGEWVDLTALRPKLADIARGDLDRVLEQMLDSADVQLEPEPFGHRIGAAERAAAVHIGGEDRHKLAIGLR